MTTPMVVGSTASSGGELAELYAQLGQPLQRLVRAGVRAPDAVVEDACQVAWSRLLRHRERVCPETTLGWLSRTATREALRLVGQESREESLERELEEHGEEAVLSLAPGPQELCEARERLEGLGALSRRQQRLIWLQAIGLSYKEMARHERCTRRTVERQLLRAKGAMRAWGR